MANDNPDTEMGTMFWRQQPHLFIPAHWGPKYCRCCLDPQGSEVHTDETDPATHVGNCTDYPVARPDQVIYAVNAWSDNGGSCSFGARPTYAEALEFANEVRKNGDNGRFYDHFQIDERRYRTVCDTNVAVLPD